MQNSYYDNLDFVLAWLKQTFETEVTRGDINQPAVKNRLTKLSTAIRLIEFLHTIRDKQPILHQRRELARIFE